MRCGMQTLCLAGLVWARNRDQKLPRFWKAPVCHLWHTVCAFVVVTPFNECHEHNIGACECTEASHTSMSDVAEVRMEVPGVAELHQRRTMVQLRSQP
jgi:hypothetical protein